MKSLVIRMTKAIVGAAYILLSSYLLYSGFQPSRISRQFFNEVGSPAEFIHPGYFAALMIVGLVLLGDGILEIRAVFKGGHKPQL